MKISIMQPYLFPYIGYFQMINCSDYFIIDDQDQYIKKGWVNRNRILLNGKDHLITLPVVRDNYRLNINERYFVDDPDKRHEAKLLNTIYHAYHNAPYFEERYRLIEEILDFENKNVADYTGNSLKKICSHLGIDTPIFNQSEINPPKHLDYQESIFYVCQKMKADCYINAIGGTELYSHCAFNKNNLTLRFIKTRESLKYRQYWNEFVPNLSIIDVMMFNSDQDIQNLLSEYDLVKGRICQYDEENCEYDEENCEYNGGDCECC